MNRVPVLLCILTASLAAQTAAKSEQVTSTYVIVAHTGYEYTVHHGRNIMKVTYSESQTSTAKPGFPAPDFICTPDTAFIHMGPT